MYRCHFCNRSVAPRTPARRVILAWRTREYPVRPKAFAKRTKQGKIEYIDDPGGIGWEIAQEVLACASCAGAHQEVQQVE
jgi:hypothetical protein